MPYVFPNEHVFMWGIGLLILVLIGLRVVMARKISSQEPSPLPLNQKPPVQ